MDDKQILQLVKFNLGISTEGRDSYLLQLIKGAKSDLAKRNVKPEGQSEDYQNAYYYFLHDYVAWMYRNRGGETSLAPGLRFRLNNLIVEYENVE